MNNSALYKVLFFMQKVMFNIWYCLFSGTQKWGEGFCTGVLMQKSGVYMSVYIDSKMWHFAEN